MNDTVTADFVEPRLWATERSRFRVAEICGRENVLGHGSLLVELAEHCGQRGAVDHLAFRFSEPYFGSKLPWLFLFHDASRGSPGGVSPIAAVLLNEYRLLGLRTGMYMPADLTGEWTILAPSEMRAEVAHSMAAHLLGAGAHVVLLSCSGLQRPASPHRGLRVQPEPVASAERTMLQTLPLCASLETTLGSMGAHTRRNLRLARRQATAKLQACFEQEAQLSESEFLALNQQGFYPVPERVARWRYRSAHESAGGFITGVRTAKGEWMALLGGRRYGANNGLCTAVDWQWNRTSFARYSPGSLMRILLIENELELGTVELRFEGGTPHSMRSAFRRETVTDLLYKSSRLPTSALRLLGRVLPKGNLLGDVLGTPELVWRRSS